MIPLEATLQVLIRHTERSFSKVNNSFIDLHNEMNDFKDEMAIFKDEMKEFKSEMARKWGGLANRLGTLAEDIVAPNLIPAARNYFNCQDEHLDFMPRRVFSPGGTRPDMIRAPGRWQAGLEQSIKMVLLFMCRWISIKY